MGFPSSSTRQPEPFQGEEAGIEGELEKLRILHLEDDSGDAELVSLRLKEEGLLHEMRWVQGREDFELAIREDEFDLVLADYSLRGFSGLEALGLIRGSLANLPFIFVSGSIGEERAIECLKLGARDYVLKDRLARLVPVILRAVEESRSMKDKRRSQAALEEAHQRQRILLDAVCAAGVVPWALQQGRLTLGDSASHLLQLPASSLPTTLEELELLVHPEDRAAVGLRFKNVQLQVGSASLFECRLRKADGGYIWTRWTRTISASALGGIFQDVGEQHRLHEQLLQGQKMASLGVLAGRVAHDFNNIVQAIVGQSEVLALNEELGVAERRGLGAIHRAGERGIELIRQLRTFAKGEVIHRWPTDLRDLVHEVEELHANALAPKIRLELDLPEEMASVLADQGQLHQVLSNLVVNARDALLPEGGRITLRAGIAFVGEAQATLQRQLPGEYAFLEVEDDGPGIPEGIALHIFEPYFTTKGDRGTGLGLSVVCGIAEAHGGWITCDSALGKGTRFRLYLPRSLAPPETPAAERGGRRVPGTSPG